MDEDRYARVTVTTLKGKKVETPSTGIVLRTPKELRAFIKFKLTYPTPNIGFIVSQLHNADSTTSVLTGDNLSKFVDYPKNAISELTRNSIVMVEPGTEYPYSDPLKKLKRILASECVPSPLRRLFRDTVTKKQELEKTDKGKYAEWRTKNYLDFWRSVDSTTALRTELLTETLKKERLAGGDFGIPGGPLIVDSETMEISTRINDKSKYLWSGRLRCATNLTLDPRTLENDSLVDDLVSYLKNTEPAKGESDMVILKFKNWDLTMPEVRLNQRKGFRYLINKIEMMKMETPSRLFVLLEAGYQLYPSMVAGFDVVSTSFTGYDGDSEFGRNGGWGSFYDPKMMVHIGFNKIRDLGRFCLCKVCEQVTDITALTRDYWNFQICRPHFGLTINSMVTEVRKLIATRAIQDARGRLEKSELSILKGLIPDAPVGQDAGSY